MIPWVPAGKVFLKYVLPLALLAYALWSAYDFIYTRGAAAKEAQLRPRIEQLEKNLKSERDVVAATRATAKLQDAAHKRALQMQHDDYVQLLAKAQLKLDRSQANVKKLKEQIDEQATKLVTAAGDAGCRVPAGFVRLHNYYASADPGAAEQAPAIPAGGSADVDAPSGVALSVVGKTVAQNYLACKQDQETLRQWQQWYQGAYAAWLKAAQEQGNFKIVMPLESAP